MDYSAKNDNHCIIDWLAGEWQLLLTPRMVAIDFMIILTVTDKSWVHSEDHGVTHSEKNVCQMVTVAHKQRQQDGGYSCWGTHKPSHPTSYLFIRKPSMAWGISHGNGTYLLLMAGNSTPRSSTICIWTPGSSWLPLSSAAPGSESLPPSSQYCY